MADGFHQAEGAIAADVVIVGGGPVGMGLAIELGRRGVTCIVAERQTGLHRIPKGQNITQRTGEHFRLWGVAEEIRNACIIPHDYGIEGVTAYGALLSGYAYDWFRRDRVRPYYFADNERLPQYATEAVLRRRAAELENVQTLFGWAATGLAAGPNGVTVRISNAESGEQRVLRGGHAVACDGARSFVRQAAGLTRDIVPHGRRMVLVVFRSKQLHHLLERFAGKSYYKVLKPELEGYWQFLGRVDLGESWFFHAPVPADTTWKNFDFSALLHGAVGAEFAIDFDHIGFWDLSTALARSYRRGRVLVAGDAAHSHPPYGGFGINAGFEDARNLGWKLAAELEGWAGPGLLDSYGAERQPVLASTTEAFIGRMIRTDRDFLSRFNPGEDPAAFEAEWARRAAGGDADVLEFAPNYEGSEIVFGPPGGTTSARGKHGNAARAGHHLSPPPLSVGPGLFEALGAGFTLLAFGAGGGVMAAFETAARRLGIPLKIVADAVEGGRETYEAPLILVRPDHFVAWAGECPAPDAHTVLARAVGGLRS